MKNPAEVQGCGCGVVGVKAKDAGLDSRGQQGSCHLHVCSCTLGRTAFACYILRQCSALMQHSEQLK